MEDTYKEYARTLRSLLEGIRAGAPCRHSVNPLRHDWIVFTTYTQDRWLGVMCRWCGSDGVVQNPSRKQWRRAYTAPGCPYRFSKPRRVRLIQYRPHIGDRRARTAPVEALPRGLAACRTGAQHGWPDGPVQATAKGQCRSDKL